MNVFALSCGPASDRPPRRARHTVLVACATAIAILGLAASPALADTGSVYFDNNENAAAGETNQLFNATFTGAENVGLGRAVMTNLTTGSSNVATGDSALFSNTTGAANVATGTVALHDNTSGADNTAIGNAALTSNMTGLDNVATGPSALFYNRKGDDNVATGMNALLANRSGNKNVAIGRGALSTNTTGNANIAIGFDAGQNLTTGANNVDIGNVGRADEAGTIRIGNSNKQTTAFIAGISGTTLGGATQPVVVKSNGQLGVVPAASAKASAAKPLSAAAGRRLLVTVKRQQRQIARQAKEIQALRAKTG